MEDFCLPISCFVVQRHAHPIKATVCTYQGLREHRVLTLSALRFGSTVGPSSARTCTNSSLQEEGGSVFILQWAVSGHHYLTLHEESYKQMLAARSAAIACLALAAARAGKDDPGTLSSEGTKAGTNCAKR